MYTMSVFKFEGVDLGRNTWFPKRFGGFIMLYTEFPFWIGNDFFLPLGTILMEWVEVNMLTSESELSENLSTDLLRIGNVELREYRDLRKALAFSSTFCKESWCKDPWNLCPWDGEGISSYKYEFDRCVEK